MENCEHPVIVLERVHATLPPRSRVCTVCHERFALELTPHVTSPIKIAVSYPKDAA